jgi:hypothetical protein
MIPNNKKRYVRGKGLVDREQPEDMDIQGGSDENSPYEKRWGVKGK